MITHTLLFHGAFFFYLDTHFIWRYVRANNLRHLPGDMHIAMTVTFVLIYDKFIKSAQCREKSPSVYLTKHVYFSTALYQKC